MRYVGGVVGYAAFAGLCLWRGDYGVRGSAMAELGLLAEAGAVALPMLRVPLPIGLTMRRVLRYASMLGRPVIQHAEDPILAEHGEMHESEHSMRLGHARDS